MLWGNICGSVFEFKRLITFGIKHFLKNILGCQRHCTSPSIVSNRENKGWVSLNASGFISCLHSIQFIQLQLGPSPLFLQSDIYSNQLFSLSLQFRRPNHEAWLATCLNSLNQGFSKQFLRQIECLQRSCCFRKSISATLFCIFVQLHGGSSERQ